MVGESNENVLLIDASSFKEFEISEFEIARVDCICLFVKLRLFVFCTRCEQSSPMRSCVHVSWKRYIISYLICVFRAIGRLRLYSHVTKTYTVIDGTL